MDRGKVVGTVAYPAVGILVVAAALVSAFASSTATIQIQIRSRPLLSRPGLAPLGVLAAIAVSTTLVDVSPLSSGGALVVAGAPAGSQRPLFRAMLTCALVMVVAVPLLAWPLLGLAW